MPSNAVNRYNFRGRLIIPLLLVMAGLFTAAGSFAADTPLFGPKRYDRAQGKPWAFTDSFNGCANLGGQALLRVQNGSSRDSSLSSALIVLNGTNILAEADFKNQPSQLEKTVTIRPGSNTLSTQLKSGGQKATPYLIVTVVGLGCDSTPPVISSPLPADGALLNILRPVISASYGDSSGGAGIDTASVRVTLDGSDITTSCTVGGTSVSCTPGVDLPEGGHNVTLTVSDLLGNAAAVSWKFVTDTIPPRAAITAPTVGQYLATPLVTVSGSIDDPTASVTVNGKAATVSGPSFSVVDLPLQEGANTLTAVAVDRAGNRSESSVTVTVDTSLPRITIIAPASGSFTGSSPVTVSGAVSELPSTFTVNGAAAVVAPDLTFTVPVPLAEGLNTITVQAADRAGNPGSANVTVTLDTVKPVITVTAPANGLLTRTAQVAVSGSVNEPLASLTVNGQPLAVSPDSTFTASLPLSEGANTIVIDATDLAGNKGSATAGVTLDSTPPVAPQLESLVTPTNVDSVTVSGSAEPWSNVALYNGSERIATVVVPENGGFSLPGILLHEGDNLFTATALDPAGNESSYSQPVLVVRDIVKPVITVTTPVDKAIVNTPVVTVSGAIDDPTATVTVNGLPANNSGGVWSREGFTLQEGANSLLVEARDPAGNLSTVQVAITLDTVKPVVTIAAPAPDLYTNIRQLAVSGTVSEEAASFTVNGVPVPLSSGLTFTSTVTLAEGQNVITAEAVDKAGNKGGSSVSVTLDTIAPQLSIIGPEDGALLNSGAITFGGTPAEPVTSVIVNGVAAPPASGGYTLPVTLNEGTNSLTVTALDRAGNSTTFTRTVTLDTIPPVITLSSPISGSYTNNPQTVVSGSVSEPVGSLTVNGVPAAVNGLNFTAPLTLAEGGNSIVIEAVDPAGNKGTATVGVILDTVKPVITVTAPQSGLVTNLASVEIGGTVSEELASLTVNGEKKTVNGSAFTHTLTLLEGENSALIVATDKAGNVATTTVIVKRDTVAPRVTIAAPASGVLTNIPQITVSGTVDDATATLTANGSPVTLTGNTFSFSYLLNDGDNGIVVTALDPAGNSGSATVNASLDAILPVVTVSAPAEAAAGANIAINLTASDNRQLTLVELKADGVPIWSGGNGPAISEAVSYRLSPTLNAGAVVTLQAKGIDPAGNEGTAPATIRITQAAMGPGYLQGKVLEDGRGLKLEGGAVAITDATGVARELTTAADGGYFLETPAGSALVRAVKPGYTTVERTVPVIPEKNIAVLDARLTKISDFKNLIDATGGVARVDAGSKPALTVELNVPAAALPAPADIRLTPISNQGLVGLLPLGWSPLAAVDVRCLDPITGASVETTFAAAATVKLPLPASITIDPAALPILARYDETAHQWLAVGSVQLDGQTSATSPQPSALSPIPSTGQYALVLADTANAPAAPVAGAPLAAAAAVTLDYAAVTTAGKVVPQAAPPSTGLKAAGEVVLTAREGATPVFTSGLILGSRITEKFDLKSGDKVESPVYSQDVILYRYPCVSSIGAGAVTPVATSGAELRTTFPVSPSRDYTIVDLLLGKVGIEITVPDTSESGVMVGPDGGRLVDADGNILGIPQGALGLTTPVSTKTATPIAAVGSDFTLIRAVEVNLTRQTLAQSATISIPAPQGLDTTLPLIVAKQIDVKGVAKLKLVALARQSGTLISSEPLDTQAWAGAPRPYINSSGVYYFLQAKGQLGFVTGSVTDGGNAPFTGALVKTDSGSLVDLSASTGKYLVAAPVAPFVATATDLYKGDEVSADSALTAANQAVTVDLKILMIPPRVASITPANGAANVQPDVPVVVTFSKPMDKSSVNSTTLKLTDSTGAYVPGVITFSVDNKTATIYPSEQFKQETSYTVTIAAAVKDLQGYNLQAQVTSGFTVRKTTPPPMPPAGAISGTFPDADGFITVTGTQGSADPNDTVLLINDTTGEITSVKPATNGSFTGKVRGQLGDEIKVVLMDYSGNQTLVSYIVFKNDDGKYLVTAKGGKVEGDGGSLLDIPEGALVGPAIVKVTALPEANLPSPLQAPGRYLGAVNIDTGGIPFSKEVHLSIPLPAGFDPATPVFVTRPSEVTNEDGSVEKVYEIIDSTKVINGRITTASPPFDGVMAFGSYAFTAFPEVNIGIVSGYTFQDMNSQPGYQEPPSLAAWEELVAGSNPVDRMYVYDRPVARAVVRTPAAWNYVSYANAKGFYAGMTTLYGNVGATDLEYKVTAIHPLTMQCQTITGYLTADGSQSRNIERLNFRLADKGTAPLDKDPPVIDITAAMVPGQGLDARYIDGLASVGTELAVTITVTDKAMGPASLSVELTSDVNANMRMTPLSLGTPTITSMGSVQRYTYPPDFGVLFSGSSSQTLKPIETGLFRLIVDARDAAGNLSSKSLDIRVANPGELPASLDGPPTVRLRVPDEGKTDVMIDSTVTVFFSEAVTGVSKDTFTLYDLTSRKDVPATVHVDIGRGQMKAVLTPLGNLAYGHTYKASLLSGIKDTALNPSAGVPRLLDLAPTEWQFTTKMPTADRLTDNTFAARDIDYYAANGKQYAYVAAGSDGWRVVDISDITEMKVVWPPADYKFPANFDYRNLAVDQQNSLMAMTDNVNMGSPDYHFGYVRFYSLANPEAPVVIGREKLAEAMSGIPGRVVMLNDYAYVSTAGVGLQVVDIKATIDRQKAGGASDGSDIVGGFDTTSPKYYGSPMVFAPYRSSAAALTTTSGQLLTLDLTFPTMPTLVSDNPIYDPDSTSSPRATLRFGVMSATADFPYLDPDSGSLKMMDLAVVSHPSGGVRVVDLTDPVNPKPLPLAIKQDTTVAKMYAKDIAINSAMGLAVVTALDGVYVIDIRNPFKPQVLMEKNELPTSSVNSDGTPVIVNLAGCQALVEKDGKAYLVNPVSSPAITDPSSVKVIDLGARYKISCDPNRPCSD